MDTPTDYAEELIRQAREREATPRPPQSWLARAIACLHAPTPELVKDIEADFRCKCGCDK